MDDTDTVEAAAETAISLLTVLGYGALGLAAGICLSVLMSVFARALRRRHPSLGHVSRRVKAPQRTFFAVLGTGLGIATATSARVLGAELGWRPLFLHIFLMALIVAAGYLLSAALFAVEDAALDRFRGVEETGHARRVRTQMQVIRRVGVVIVWISVVGGILLTFESFRAIGASLFASAGVLSLVVGLAAQSSLGNLFAGVQIAFTDALRVGDVVVVNGQFGNVEEITLTYVVLRVWDDRRIVLPSTQFTNQPFENWTRREPDLLGTVELDLDFTTPIPALRVELQRIVESSDLWDSRTAGLQVTDAIGGHVRVRAVVSARNSGQLFDLRCLVREELIAWLTASAPYALPRTRLEPETSTAPPIEDVREFIEEVERQWAEEKSAEETTADATQLIAVEESDTERLRREEDARRARREAEKADRRAARRNPAALSGHRMVLPLPSSDDTHVIADPAALGGDAGAAADATPRPSDVRPTTPRASILRQPGDPHSAEARLFSGSPEAEERATRLAGPSAADMAEREEAARRRSHENKETS